LCTAADDGKHYLRLYDVRRKDGKRPLQHIQLDTLYVDPEHEPREGEVTAVRFSPDGLLLAVARSDDELHVYDSRFMGRSREPMSRFLHWEEECCLSGDKWGIVDAVWVDGWCGRGMGVVSGGSDGEVPSHAFSPARSLIRHHFLFVLKKKAAFVFGTCADQTTISRMARSLHGQTPTLATSPWAIRTTAKSHLSCGCCTTIQTMLSNSWIFP